MRVSRALFGVCLSLGACSFVVMVAAAPPSVASASAAAAAPRDPQAIWDKLCKSCHGADGKGVAAKAATLKIDPVLLNLGREGTDKITRDELKVIVLEGKEKMPAYKTKVKPEEIDALVELAETLATSARKTP